MRMLQSERGASIRLRLDARLIKTLIKRCLRFSASLKFLKNRLIKDAPVNFRLSSDVFLPYPCFFSFICG